MKLPCLHGWYVRCRRCAALAEALEAEFWRDVFFGVYSDRGYTPQEWARRR